MTPVTRRTWAPAGRTPVLKQVGRSFAKISVIGAICMRPNKCNRIRAKAFFRLYPQHNVDAAKCREFLRQLLVNVRKPIIVVWDRLKAHRSIKVRKFVQSTNGRLSLEYFPPYAPDLNPTEYLWAHLKGHSLSNYVPKNAEDLFKSAKRGLCKTRRNKSVLLACIDHSSLSF